MKQALRCTSVVLLTLGSAGCVERCARRHDDGAESRVLAVKHARTVKLPVGTHRPEMVVNEKEEVLVVVVQPEGSPGPKGQIKHQAHRFDARWRPIGSRQVVSRVESGHGEPADHRVALVNGELVVVYQSLRWKKGHPTEGAGPAEDHALDQSLMLARFDPSGKELSRAVIVERNTDFSRDNFPDHCILWRGGRLLVSTGSKDGSIRIRQVDPQARVLATHIYQTSARGIQGAIGNSMLERGGALAMFSSTVAGSPSSLALVEFDEGFVATLARTFSHKTRDRRFPTSSMMAQGFTLVTYISLPRGTSPDHRSNHYSPYLLMLDRDLKVMGDIRIGKGDGFGHVHPTLARAGKRLLVAWSRRVPHGSVSAPQVLIEEYAVSVR